MGRKKKKCQRNRRITYDNNSSDSLNDINDEELSQEKPTDVIMDIIHNISDVDGKFTVDDIELCSAELRARCPILESKKKNQLSTYINTQLQILQSMKKIKTTRKRGSQWIIVQNDEEKKTDSGELVVSKKKQFKVVKGSTHDIVILDDVKEWGSNIGITIID
jgi:hypothetical protein